MSPATDPPPPHPWLRLQFSMRTLFWLMLVVGMALVWWRDRSSLDQRLRKLEQMYTPASQSLWGAADILGAPDDPTGVAGKSWCPASPNRADWVEVGFDRPVAAATIDLYETYSVGCVTKVVVIDRTGPTVVWNGTDPTPATARNGLFKVPAPNSIKSVERVRVYVNSTGKGSWACIDAVGLTTAAGKSTWATSSNSSSVYGGGALSASSKKRAWYDLW